jgi:hypothetical protein
MEFHVGLPLLLTIDISNEAECKTNPYPNIPNLLGQNNELAKNTQNLQKKIALIVFKK